MTALPVADTTQTRAWLRTMLGARRLRVLAAVVVLVAASVSALALPATLGRIVDAVAGADTGRLPLLIGIVAGAGILHALLAALGRLLVSRLGEEMLAELRFSVVARLLRLPSGVVEKAGRGDLVARAAGDARVVGDVVTSLLPAFAGAAFSIVVTLIGLGAIDPRFALAALAAAPVQFLATRRYLRRARPAYLAARDAQGDRSQRMLESVDAAATIRAMDASSARDRHIDEAATTVVERELRATRISVAFWNQLNVAELVGLAAVLATGFALVGSGATTIGGATAAALYFHALFGPIGAVLGGIDELQKASAALSRMVGVLTLTERPERLVRAERSPVEVALEDVGFGYEQGFRLHGVRFAIPAGSTTALVGASGAGKSTIAALVLGALPPASGRLLLGGVSPSETGCALPRVGLAGQEPHVFAGTLAENLRLARPEAGDEELREVLSRLDARHWVDRLPDGLDTVVGAGGHGLTVVEAQQLALARLLLHDPDVLVLDEATAAAGGDRSLDRAVAQVTAGRTTLTIAHRLDQAERADHIVVLDDGRVVEQGTHDDLVAAGGPYTRIWEAWSRGPART
ncbi:MAG TPA: ABC transporter ATP-binding protein [Arachnia sp.]|nr:ABC transporter ATP-binding protein [Arachnia sp.]HMT85011.1 ABC transporter ATP-binding protein [Arachnia sp.]